MSAARRPLRRQALCDKGALPYACADLPAVPTLCDPSSDGPCAAAVCAPATGTCAPKARNDGLGCDDGDPCSDAYCSGGACVSAGSTCPCGGDDDCAALDDADACNGKLYCDKGAWPWSCAVNPASVVACDASADTACSVTVCQPATGACTAMARADVVAVPCSKAELQQGKKQCYAPASEANPASSATPTCDDGDPCTAGDHCEGKGCVAGATPLCSCAQDSDCALQEDGNLCNGTLYCELASGTCAVNPATVQTCASAQDTDCLKNACVPALGVCLMSPVEQVVALKADASGEPCAAGEPCRYQTLPPGQKQKGPFACDDGDPCSQDELCVAGNCSAGTDLCLCASDADCAAQDDGDLCNGTLFCNQISKKCQLNPKSVVTCPSVDDDACSKNLCQPKVGACAMTPVAEGAACDADGSPCTVADACAAGTCKAGPNICACLGDSDCKALDGDNVCLGSHYCDKSGLWPKCAINPKTVVTCPSGSDTACSKSLCDAKTGACAAKAVNEGKVCDDGTLCTHPKVCAGGSCALGANIDCDDDNPCTQEACDAAKGCVYKAQDGTACDDGSGCTTDDLCVLGFCTGTPADCDDDNPCTTDLCAPKFGCKHYDNAKSCSDGDACTSDDACKGGVCAGKAVACADDGVACTKATCDANKGCEQVPVDAGCDDGNPCTSDVCDAKLGCVAVALGGGDGGAIACDDGDPCTANDTCVAGACRGGSSPKVATSASFEAGVTALAVDGEGKAWVATLGMLHLIAKGEGQTKPVQSEALAGGPVASLAIDGDGALLALRGGWLGKRAAKGSFALRARGIGGGRGLTVSGGDAYAVGHDAAGHRLHRVAAKAADGAAAAIVAGDGAGYVDGVGWEARFDQPRAVAAGPDGALTIVDWGNRRLRRATMTAGGFARVGTLAGSGKAALVDGKGAGASFVDPVAVATDALGRVYVAEGSARRLRRVDRDGVVVTIAGGDGGGQLDGAGDKAAFAGPRALAIDTTLTLLVGDGAALRRVQPSLGDCSDGGPCTVGACDGKGGCVFAAAGPVPCADDGNACTDDRCAGKVCIHPAAFDAQACDGDRCTAKDACEAGTCAGAVPATGVCADDGNPCAAAVCAPHAARCARIFKAGPGCLPTRRVFVTSAPIRGDFAAQAFGDRHARCRDAADAAGLGGSFVTLGELPGGRPATPLGAFFDAGVRRIDGEAVAVDGRDLIDGAVQRPIWIDEHGAQASGAAASTCQDEFANKPAVWSRMTSVGATASASCEGWSTLGSGCTTGNDGTVQCQSAAKGAIGATTLSEGDWSSACASALCTESHRLWCIDSADVQLPDACTHALSGDGNRCGGGSGRCNGASCACPEGERLESAPGQPAACVACACDLAGSSKAWTLRPGARVDVGTSRALGVFPALGGGRLLVGHGAEVQAYVDDGKGGWVAEASSGVAGMLAGEAIERLAIDSKGQRAAVLVATPTGLGADVFAPYFAILERQADASWATVLGVAPALAASVAIEGDVAVFGRRLSAGDPGAHVYRRGVGGNWTLAEVVLGKATDDNKEPGSAVALSKGRLAMSVPQLGDTETSSYGVVRVFDDGPGGFAFTGTAVADADAKQPNARLGGEIALEGDHLAATSRSSSPVQADRVIVFARQPNGAWKQAFTMTHPHVKKIEDLLPTVALRNGVLLYGSPMWPQLDASGGVVAGAKGGVEVVRLLGGTWQPQGTLAPSHPSDSDLPFRIAFDGGRAALAVVPGKERASVLMATLAARCNSSGPACTCLPGKSGPTCSP